MIYESRADDNPISDTRHGSCLFPGADTETDADRQARNPARPLNAVPNVFRISRTCTGYTSDGDIIEKAGRALSHFGDALFGRGGGRETDD